MRRTRSYERRLRVLHCSRCTGLMHEEVAYGENEEVTLQYCINCGERLDDVIVRNREFPELPEVVKVRRRYPPTQEGELNEGNAALQVRNDSDAGARCCTEKQLDTAEEEVQREASEGDLPRLPNEGRTAEGKSSILK